MKKFLSILFCILLFGGCETAKTKEVKIEPLNFSGFNCCVYTEKNGIKISANLEYKAYEKMTFTFLEPDNMKNLIAECEKDEIIIKKDSLTFSYAYEKLPFNMMCKTIKMLIEKVNGAELLKEGQYLLSTFQCEGHNCTLYIDINTRNFIKLNIDGEDKVFFENFEFVK